MHWDDVRQAQPNQWLVIEACPDGAATMKRYRELHRSNPERELCCVHTSNAELDIVERFGAGLRTHALDASGVTCPSHRSL